MKIVAYNYKGWLNCVLALLVVSVFCQLAYADKQISQFGITWAFDRDYPTGQFANGDYWVVGPVTIIGINPLSTETDGRTINGSMINPLPALGSVQGFDSAMYGKYKPQFDAELNVGRPNGKDISLNNPLTVQVASSLISTVSNSEAGHRPQLKTAAILTVLAKPAAEGSFRPSYCGSDKSIKFNKSQLNYSVLKNLKPVPSVPALAEVERYFERPWIDYIPNWTADYCHPSENMPNYGRNMSSQIGVGSLILNLYFTNQQKEKLLVRYIQVGLDFHGIIQNGGENNWPCNGGVTTGRKFPILFAGVMLDDKDMKEIGDKSGDYLYSQNHDSGNPPADYIHFCEDDQTFYVDDNDIYKPPYKKNSSHGFTYYGHGNRGKKRDYIEYKGHHRAMPEWGINHATDRNVDGLDWDAAYRRCCTANSWAGFILAVHVMGLQELWNHDVLFDYMDRYMQIEARLGRGTFTRQWSRFTEDMWDYYRYQYVPVWTMSPELKIAAVEGKVKINPDKSSYSLGEEVILKAVADDGYEFVGWAGDLAGTENPARVVMCSNRSIIANFAVYKNGKE